MNKQEIMQILPHRENMLLVDDVTEENGEAVGHYHVRGDEFFLKGHFPGNPIVPGVILCEILAQSACVLLKEQMTEGKLPVYTGLNNVKFRSPVKPGDVIETRCHIKRAKHPCIVTKVKIIPDKSCASPEDCCRRRLDGAEH